LSEPGTGLNLNEINASTIKYGKPFSVKQEDSPSWLAVHDIKSPAAIRRLPSTHTEGFSIRQS